MYKYSLLKELMSPIPAAFDIMRKGAIYEVQARFQPAVDVFFFNYYFACHKIGLC